MGFVNQVQRVNFILGAMGSLEWESLEQERDTIRFTLYKMDPVIGKECRGRQPDVSLGGHGNGQVSQGGGLAGGGKK